MNENQAIRINKFLSEAGVCSRREADRLVEEGRVKVNGHVLTAGEKILPTDEVFVDGTPIKKEEKKVLLLFYKPRGIVCSTKQQKGDTTVIDYLSYPIRVYPVGRLDKESEGLLLLTNEGDLVNKIMRAGNYHEKEYHVKVNKDLDEDFVRRMSSGIPILDTVTRPCTVERTGKHSFRIILTQGLNRQIRRMCEYLGYQVTELKRVRIMNLTIAGLKKGEYREISSKEREKLEKMLQFSSSETVTGGNYGRKNSENERISTKAESGGKGLLSGRSRDHEQSGVRQTVRRASENGRGNRNRSGRQSNHKRRV